MRKKMSLKEFTIISFFKSIHYTSNLEIYIPFKPLDTLVLHW